ncbi:hypothetical protein ABZ736_28025 [Streptomyces sp. NPDC013099]
MAGRGPEGAAATSLCEEIRKNLQSGLAARRYAMSGNRRALYGTVL